MIKDGAEFKNRRTGELGEIVNLADGYRLKIKYGFSKWYPSLELLREDWEEM